MPELTSGRLCRLALTEMLPALRREDYPRFAAAVSEYGRLVGEFFSPWQGGVYSSPVMQTLIGDLAREGTLGAAQSSWGPAVALFAANEIQAQDLKARVRRHPAGKACRIEICAPLNQGRLLLEDAAPAGRSGESGVLATEAQRHGEEGEEAVPG
jgi:predicted sugar kinase